MTPLPDPTTDGAVHLSTEPGAPPLPLQARPQHGASKRRDLPAAHRLAAATARFPAPAAALLLSSGLLLTLAARAQPAETSAAAPGVQIITAEDITRAGLSRLSELFTLIDDWYTESIEGFTWNASANGLASLQEASWGLLIDGQPVDPGILDTRNINILPLSIAEIAYVEVINTPALVSGVFAQAGVLHFHTRQPAPGAALEGTISAGNEVGDPGPYRYTAFGSPNIDRIGPTVQGAVSYGGAAWHARAHFKSDEHHATDERILPRVQTLYLGEKAPRLLLTSGGLDLGAAGRTGRHSLFAAFSRLQDLLFLEPLGLEAPTDHYLYHLGLGGDFWPGRPTGLSYRLSYTINDLDPRANRSNLDFNWRQNTFRSHYEVRTGDGRMRGALGLSYDLIQSFTGVALTDPRLIIPRAYGRFAYTADPRWQPELTAYVSRVKGRAGYGALATLSVHPAAGHTLTLTGSFARQPYQEKNRIWYWVAQGYPFFEQQGADLNLPAGFAASTTYTADLAWRFQPSGPFGITLSGAFRRFDDLTLASYAFSYDLASTALRPRTEVRGSVFGRVMKVGAEIRFRPFSSLEHRLHYAYVRYPTRDEVYFEAWRNQPWHRLSYAVRYAPLSRLSLYGRLSYASGTEWPAYRAAAAASNGRYQAQLPGYWLLDFSAQKRFWRDHLNLSLSLRNFLNEPYRLHPVGAVTNMVFQVRVQLYFHHGNSPEG